MPVGSADMQGMRARALVSRALVIALLGAMSGCASGPKFSGLEQTAQGKADIYVYREAAIFAAIQDFEIAIDGRKVGNLANGSYLKIQVGPGAHLVRASTGTG